MTEQIKPQRSVLMEHTAKIVAAHAAHHKLGNDALISLINRIYGTLRDLNGTLPENPARPVPAVPAKRSVFPEYIICLEDGKKLKMLKRHLKSAYNLTPDEYRQKWDLPPDYPMVASNYVRHRSSLAKSSGLGRAGRKLAPAKGDASR